MISSCAPAQGRRADHRRRFRWLRRPPWLAAWIVGLSLFLCAAVPAFADHRVALVIGNSTYKNTLSLPNPANDARDVAAALRSLGFEVVFGVDLDRRGTEDALQRFARTARGADVAFFFYAGHGMQFGGHNYLMPIDAQLQDEISVRYEMTSIDDVREALQAAPGSKIMVLDACRDNPLAEQLSRSIAAKTRSVPNVRGFSQLAPDDASLVEYSTQANQVAEDGTGRNSPFTTALLAQLKEPGLEVGALFRRVGNEVYRSTNGAQSPELSISLHSDVYLNQGENDAAAWATVKTSQGVEPLRDFIARFPKSPYAEAAQLRLAQIESVRAADAQQRQHDAGAEVASETERHVAVADASPKPSEIDEAERARQQREAHDKDVARQQALDEQAAKAKAEAEKAADVKKAAELRVATATPPAADVASAVLKPEQVALIAPIQAELRRLGCHDAGGDWTSTATQLGLARYASQAKLAALPEAPSAALLDELKGQRDRVCPSECSAREVEMEGRCVARVCDPGATMNADGACVRANGAAAGAAKPVPRMHIRNAARPARLAEPRAAAWPRWEVRRNAPSAPTVAPTIGDGAWRAIHNSNYPPPQ